MLNLAWGTTTTCLTLLGDCAWVTTTIFTSVAWQLTFAKSTMCHMSYFDLILNQEIVAEFIPL
ncbi:unnamed protein product [Amoebophrya sp. A25]|nr:unnamed protein product [Amoebophrya sp. A25]|eukprot:GSA25T00002854001.1